MAQAATAPDPATDGKFAVELTQNERMQIISILPQQGDLATVRKVRLLRDALNLQPEERPKPQTAPGVPVVQPQPIQPKIFSFSLSTRTLIVRQLEILEQQKKFPVDYLDLYDKFTFHKPVPEIHVSQKGDQNEL